MHIHMVGELHVGNTRCIKQRVQVGKSSDPVTLGNVIAEAGKRPACVICSSSLGSMPKRLIGRS